MGSSFGVSTPKRTGVIEPAALHLDGVSIAIGGRTLFGPISAVVAAGECLTLMGPSGCGKSTLLAFLSGALEPAFTARGSVRIGATDITLLPPESRRVGILFQDDLLFPHLSVGANLAFALPASVRPYKARRERIARTLADAGLEGFADRDPATLSGGQRARVAVMRALSAEPRALLLDEPFSKLDAPLRGDFRRFVFEHVLSRGLPTVLVTHDEADALAAGGPLIRLASP
jgi:putative thiamine transport system ATP-binding protein